MAESIEFTEESKINSATYKKGDIVKVSDEIAKDLVANGKAKLVKETASKTASSK